VLSDADDQQLSGIEPGFTDVGRIASEPARDGADQA
jgi:hypothetical protein